MELNLKPHLYWPRERERPINKWDVMTSLKWDHYRHIDITVSYLFESSNVVLFFRIVL